MHFTEGVPDPRALPLGRLREPIKQEMAGEEVDLVSVYIEKHVTDDDINEVFNARLTLGEKKVGIGIMSDEPTWLERLYVWQFPEYWHGEPGAKDRIYTRMPSEDLNNPETVAELFQRTNEHIAKTGEMLALGVRHSTSDIESEPFDTLEALLEHTRTSLALRTLTRDLISGAIGATDPAVLQWQIQKIIGLEVSHPDFMKGAYKMGSYLLYGMNSQTTRGLIFNACNNLAGRVPERIDEVCGVASQSLKQLEQAKGGNNAPIKSMLYARVSRLDGDNQIPLSPSEQLFLWLAKEDYPEIFEREYQLRQLGSKVGTPVRPENLEEFLEYEEMLTFVPKQQAGKLMADSITLMRAVLTGLGEQGNQTAASLEQLLSVTAASEQGASPNRITTIANGLLPQLQPADTNTKLERLNPQSVEDLPRAIARIIKFVRPELTDKVEDPEDVYFIATQCAILLAEIGSANKLAQKTVSVWDLHMRYPHLTNIELGDLANGLQVTSSGNVHEIYRGLQSRNKRHVYFTKWVRGKGLLT